MKELREIQDILDPRVNLVHRAMGHRVSLAPQQPYLAQKVAREILGFQETKEIVVLEVLKDRRVSQ